MMNSVVKAAQSKATIAIEQLTMIAWNAGFESASDALDELSNELHNKNDKLAAEVLRWAAKELRGENV
jgi:bifunctional pyridoxal-dependent enzyme with beta-cystathionase and maltose regulon repressor activities